ncbi:MAG TPA: adenosylmethionine--8-amino-7-oxononanoate transaminase [Anaerolineae bacterium]|nr:adenosylmethionine--8-amino-7-oxononanoate transaminase [Anaerolineae bacterium]
MDERADGEYRILADWDKAYVWHPFTQMKVWSQEEPLIIERGEGSYLIDVKGRRYLDGISSLWVMVHGHRHPDLTKAIVSQANKIAHSTLLGLANVPSIKLARKLVELSPSGLNKVFYSDSGASAVEIALKMAFQYWQQQGIPEYRSKKRFLSLGESYHGDTIGAVSVGGIDLFHEKFSPLLFDSIKVPSPYCYHCPLGMEHGRCNTECLDVLEAVMDERHQEIAAAIIEPLVQGAAGMITAPSGYLKRMRELCTRYNILLIADEVAVGFGRTGTLFACEQEDISPDILCVAKGLTGGYLPLAATLTTDAIYDAFLGEYEESKTFFHGHTYTGNPLGCAVALANIEVIERDNLLEHVQRLSDLMSEELARFRTLEHVGDIRQRGLMVGIELVKDKASKAPYSLEENIGHRVMLKAREQGVIIRPLGSVIVLMPILSMSEAELEGLLSVTYGAIKSVTEG